MAQAAVEAGARGAAVARVSEARRLRGSALTRPILLLGGARRRGLCRRRRSSKLTPTLSDWSTAERVAAAAQRAGQHRRRAGQSRHGHDPLRRAARRGDRHRARPAALCRSLELDGFYTHFAAADDPDPFFAHQQLARYLAICEQLESEGIDLGLQTRREFGRRAARPERRSGHHPRRASPWRARYATGWVPRVGSLRAAVALKSRVVRFHTPAVGHVRSATAARTRSFDRCAWR